MRLITLLLLVWLFLPSPFTNAQVGRSISDIIGENVSIILEPQFPSPGEQVTARIDDYAFGVTGATITWFFDGLSAPNISNARTINFAAPEIGKSLRVVARLTFSNGQTKEAQSFIEPLYLDTIIEPQTYTPLFYQGRALPVTGSIVNIKALLQDGSGPVNSTDYNYNWSINNKSVYGGAVIGSDWAQISVPQGKSSVITLSVTDKQGTTVARRLFTLPAVPVELQFYEQSTLLGLQQRAITNTLILVGNSSTVKAVPYFLDIRAIERSLFSEWRINGLPATTKNVDPFEINLVRGSAGSADLTFKIINRDQFIQNDEAGFKVTF